MKVHDVKAEIGDAPEALRRAAAALGAAAVRIRAMATEGGRLRLLPDDPERAIAALAEAGIEAWIGAAIAVPIGDRPEALSEVLEKLAAEGVRVEAVYTGSSDPAGRPVGILVVSDLDAALRIVGGRST